MNGMTQNNELALRVAKNSWPKAYMRFLLSKDESIVLKVAPLALAGILPFDILSNIIPLVGELDDLGYIIMLTVVTYKTLKQVNKYR
jgi:uncharacterized membrane protein YkvA (DUF1232 family)